MRTPTPATRTSSVAAGPCRVCTTSSTTTHSSCRACTCSALFVCHVVAEAASPSPIPSFSHSLLRVAWCVIDSTYLVFELLFHRVAEFPVAGYTVLSAGCALVVAGVAMLRPHSVGELLLVIMSAFMFGPLLLCADYYTGNGARNTVVLFYVRVSQTHAMPSPSLCVVPVTSVQY